MPWYKLFVPTHQILLLICFSLSTILVTFPFLHWNFWILFYPPHRFLQGFRTQTLGSLLSSTWHCFIFVLLNIRYSTHETVFPRTYWIKFPKGRCHVYQSLFLSWISQILIIWYGIYQQQLIIIIWINQTSMNQLM